MQLQEKVAIVTLIFFFFYAFVVFPASLEIRFQYVMLGGWVDKRATARLLLTRSDIRLIQRFVHYWTCQWFILLKRQGQYVLEICMHPYFILIRADALFGKGGNGRIGKDGGDLNKRFSPRDYRFKRLFLK